MRNLLSNALFDHLIIALVLLMTVQIVLYISYCLAFVIHCLIDFAHHPCEHVWALVTLQFNALSVFENGKCPELLLYLLDAGHSIGASNRRPMVRSYEVLDATQNSLQFFMFLRLGESLFPQFGSSLPSGLLSLFMGLIN